MKRLKHKFDSMSYILRITVACLMVFGCLSSSLPAKADEAKPQTAQNIIQITGGLSHTVALKSDGTVWAWGDQQRGKLGDSVNNRYTPNRVKELADVKAIEAGMYHTLALKKDGTVWSWGANSYGQLGDGTQTDRAKPQPIPGLTDIVAIAAGNNYSVALRSDGKVFTWGDNLKGQLGDQNFAEQFSAKPIQIPLAQEIKSIASGANHVLAITANKDVMAWGDNAYSQLGNSSALDMSKYPIYVNSLMDIKAVAAGSNFSLALNDEGYVFSWGSNTVGQLGYTFWQIIVDNPIQISDIRDVTAISAGNSHAMALTKEGDLYIWGSNQLGQLGKGDQENSTVPVIMTKLGSVDVIGTGAFHSMAVKSDGSVWTWGNNTMGQLGDGTTNSQLEPLMLPGFSLKTGDTAPSSGAASYQNETVPVPLASGDSFTLAWKNGKAWGWGENTFGQLGTFALPFRNTPSSNDALKDITVIAAGSNHAAAIDKQGKLWTWGQNTSGQLGDQTTTNRNNPALVPGMDDVTAVAAGGNFTLALKKDGTVWAAGNNTFGQLADGTAEGHNVFAKIEGLPAVWAIAAGYDHALALALNGSVWSWGDNSSGQLGDGTMITRNSPVQITKLSGVTAISAGHNHSVALKTDGTIWSWGFNAFGELGDASTTNRYEPVQTGGISGMTSIAAGGYHTLAVKADGTVWSWGAGSFGQLGDGTTTNRSQPVQVKGLTGVTYIAAGTYHSAAMDRGGIVWTWGSNMSGQMGDGTFKNKMTASIVTGFKTSLNDIKGHWAQNAIESALERGWVDGYSDGSFQPDNVITRGEFAKLVSLALNLKVEAVNDNQPWYMSYMNALFKAGVYGNDDIQADGNEPATRAEIARVAVRATTTELQKPNSAVDSKYAMQMAVKKGILQGLTGGQLAPEQPTTRAQSLTVIDRILSVNQGLVLPVDSDALKSLE